MALKGWYELFKLCLLLLVLVCQRQAVRGQTDFQPDGTPEPASMQTEKCSENEAIESEISSLRSRVSHLLSVLRQFKESLDVTPPPATTQVPDYECQRPCLRIYVPVCGSDNKTYPNHCIFEIAQCMDETLTASAGECPGELPDPCADVDCDELPCPEDVQYTFDGGCCPACPQDWGLDPCHLSGTCDPDLVTVIDPCADVDCDELPCPEDVQYTFDGGCCPACPQDWGLDPCHLSGTCDPDLVTVIVEITQPLLDPCADADCDELPCPEDVQYIFDDFCCPACPQDWGLDPCHLSGTCDLDLVTVTVSDPCADVDCDELPCPEDVQYTFDGGCCPACPQDWGLDPCHLSGTCDPDLVTVIDPCADVDCDELPCPEDVQYTFDDGCCPACPQDWGLDPCHLSGTCDPDLVTVIGTPDPCADVECPVLTCPEDLQHTYDGECCPECPQDWGLDPCHFTGTCDLPTGTPDPCADVECPVLTCPEDLQGTYEGQCCPECPQDWGYDPCHFTDTCGLPTEIPDPCADVECEELPCPEHLQRTYDEKCCPQCPEDWGVDPCIIGGGPCPLPTEVPDPCADTKCYELDCPEDLQHTYDGECCPQCPEDWGLDPCHWTGTCFQPSVTTEAIPPRDCSEVDNTINGVYQVSPDGGEPVSVYCDFVTKHGPWTVIQRRSDGSVDFHQKMAEYQAGFGNLEGEFWLGLDNIHKFVSTDVYQLRIDLTNYRHVSKHATYSEFAISDESDGYRLHLGKYSGNARDSLSYHKGMQFTTRDVDRDEHDNKNCARFHKGAWWFKRCFRSNLNGRHRDPLQKRPDGIIWAFWRGYTETIPFVEMKIRRPL